MKSKIYLILYSNLETPQSSKKFFNNLNNCYNTQGDFYTETNINVKNRSKLIYLN